MPLSRSPDPTALASDCVIDLSSPTLCSSEHRQARGTRPLRLVVFFRLAGGTVVAGGYEAVAGAADAQKMSRVGRVAFEILPQPDDKIIDRAGGQRAGLLPNGRQQLRPREHLPFV